MLKFITPKINFGTNLLNSYTKSNSNTATNTVSLNTSNNKATKNDTFEKSKTKSDKNKKSKLKSVGIPVITFLTGALATAILYKATKRPNSPYKYEDKYFKLSSKFKEILAEKNADAIKTYTDENKSLRNKLNTVIDEKTSGEIDEKIFNINKDEIDKYKLDYDPLDTSKYFKKEEKEDNTDAIELGEFKPTNNRINMQEFNIPDFVEGMSSWHVKLPDTPIMKPVNANSIAFKEIENAQTNVSTDYSKSVQWDDNKVVRDIFQNFYDGHGQTLDGVDFSINKQPNNKYKVKITGKGIYTPDKAIYLGESSKRHNAESAGNYGEGLKMAVLKLLNDDNADKVITGSDNWKIVFKTGTGCINDKQVLTYSLKKVPKYSGNYLEFETDNINLLKSIKTGINSFYHSSNTDFRCPDFENSVFGLKHHENKNGSVYIAGQKFQYNDSWKGVENETIFFKIKPPKRAGSVLDSKEKIIFDPSRDRSSLNYDDLRNISEYFAADSRTSKEELVQAIHSLESVWTDTNYYSKPANKALLEGLVIGSTSKALKIKFPEKYLAETDFTDKNKEVVKELEDNGYKICNPFFSTLGMPTIAEHIKNARKHNVLSPTPIEIKKIGIIKKAIQQFRPYLEKTNSFTANELNPKIYIFNNTGKAEEATYKDTLAEAIIDDSGSLGFWIDRNGLKDCDFPEIVSTALHELTHKFGGDETSIFSYKLTLVLEKVINSIVDDKQTNIELTSLKKLWNDLSKEQIKTSE